jgi:hypothetical protein
VGYGTVASHLVISFNRDPITYSKQGSRAEPSPAGVDRCQCPLQHLPVRGRVSCACGRICGNSPPSGGSN